MLNRLRFGAYLAQSRFAQALAQLGPAVWPASSAQLWACHQLGLHATVAAGSWDGRHVKAGVAMAVSLAACGRSDEAHAVVQRLLSRRGAGPHRTGLVKALAPFMPQLALSLASRATAPAALRCALLLRLGERDQAARQLQAALSADPVPDPELHLLATNAMQGDPALQLSRLNAFVGRFMLAPLSLKDRGHPPSASNLACAIDLAPESGPLVSVVMTAHNTADRIGPAIEGLLAQTWKNLQLVVVDDASTDATADVVRALGERDARVNCVRLTRNTGTYVAKTVGLDHARGDFVTCHDSDDWSHPQKLALQMRPLLLNRQVVATTSHWVRLQDDGTFYARPVYPLMRLNGASPLFRRREVEEHTGLWDAVRTGADSEFHARLQLAFGRKAVRRLPGPLTFGAHRVNSLMTAADTGYTAQGMSPMRLAYWEAWTRWHVAELRAGRKPRMPALLAQQPRPFAVAPGMGVDRRAMLDGVTAAGD